MLKEKTRASLMIGSPTCNSPVSQRPARLPCLFVLLDQLLRCKQPYRQ
uniref:Uncharacterized protein n=1 Tax=Setaria italica TaxID=4555 RepID=K3Z1P0_SETIT